MNFREGKMGARTDRGVLPGPTAGHAGQTNKRHLSTPPPQKKKRTEEGLLSLATRNSLVIFNKKRSSEVVRV